MHQGIVNKKCVCVLERLSFCVEDDAKLHTKFSEYCNFVISPYINELHYIIHIQFTELQRVNSQKKKF